MSGARGKSFCFTLNNPTDQETDRIATLFNNGVSNGSIVYAIVGREVASTGTPHLQGFIHFSNRRRVDSVRAMLRRAHFEVARGTPDDNHRYCSKDGDFDEYGDLSKCTTQGKRSDLDAFKEWITKQTRYPSEKTLAMEWTALYMKYSTKLIQLVDLLFEAPPLETAPYRDGWQSELEQELDEAPENDRKIIFYVDEVGGSGKTWFVRKYLSENDDAQLLGIGKKDDIAYIIDQTKRIFFFNIERGGMEYLNYKTLENLKDRLVLSTKYQGKLKKLWAKPHVIVFCNEYPDMTKLTEDRYEIRECVNE